MFSFFTGQAATRRKTGFPGPKQKLEPLGCKVIVPQFPTPENQTLENWFKVFSRYKKDFSTDSILVGHSLGGAFLLRVLERSSFQIKAAFIVAAPIGVLPIKNYDGDKLFIGKPFDWERIRANCQKFFIFHSDNDPYVSLGNGRKLAENVGTKLIFAPNCGHFNKAAGFDRFDLLFGKIKTVL